MVTTRPQPRSAIGRHQGLQQFHRGAEVDDDLAIEPFAGNRLEIFGQFDGGVQHQDIDRRPGGDGGSKMPTGVVPDEILAKGGGLSSHPLDFLDDGGGIAAFLGRVGVMDGETRPGSGKP